MRTKPVILGILNLTEDSFSDGGKYLDRDAALSHGRSMIDADVLDIGAAASNPAAIPVSTAMEIARLASVVPIFQREGRSLSIDTFSADVQRWAISQGVNYLNDIEGFADPAFYPDLAKADVKLIVMHSVQKPGPASRVDIRPEAIFDRVTAFFDLRIRQLIAGGISRDRLILDPGMGFFLGNQPEASFAMLRALSRLKSAIGLPVLVSVSRKSFLRGVTGRAPSEAGPASLAAELFAVHQGADYIRTHAPSALKDALLITEKLGWQRAEIA
jgi:dihydropteroate synthase